MDFRGESYCYELDVRTVAAQLIRDGVSPWRAMELAADIVRQRRQQAAIARDLKGLMRIPRLS